MNTNTFNFEAFKNGTIKAETKLGNPARFITMLRDGRMLIEIKPRTRIVEQGTIKHVSYVMETITDKYYTNGRKYKTSESEFDLVEVKAA